MTHFHPALAIAAADFRGKRDTALANRDPDNAADFEIAAIIMNRVMTMTTFDLKLTYDRLVVGDHKPIEAIIIHGWCAEVIDQYLDDLEAA